MEISIKWNVCRVCLKEGEEEVQSCENSNAPNQLRPIFSKDNVKLSQQIFECCGVQIKSNDNLPQKICRKCLMVLKYAVNFRTTCRNSDEYLQNIVQKTKSATKLFQLDKRREESPEMVSDKIFNDEDDTDDDVGAGDASICYTKFQSSEQLTIENSKVEPKKHQRINVQIVENEHQYANILRREKTKSKEQLPPNVGNIKVESYDGVVKAVEKERQLSVENQEIEHNLMDLFVEEEQDEEFEKLSQPKATTSECSIEDDTYIEEVGEEEHVDNLDVGDDTDPKSPPFDEEEDGEKEHYEHKNETNENDDKTQTEHKSDDDADTNDGNNELFYILHDNEVKEEFNYQVDENGSNSATNNIEDSTDIEFVFPSEEEFEEIDADDRTPEVIADCNDEDNQLLSELDLKNIPSIPSRQTLTNDTKTLRSPGKPRRKMQIRKKMGGVVNVFVCDVCGNNFTSRSLLNCHMRTHRSEKNYECELCFKRFTAACNLTAHMRIHTGEKPFKCQYCGRRFTDRSTHIKHERIHTNEKPFTCTICNKSFSLSTTLRAHERIHTGEKPHKCEPCAKSFKLPHQLKAHLNTHLHRVITVEHLLGT